MGDLDFELNFTCTNTSFDRLELYFANYYTSYVTFGKNVLKDFINTTIRKLNALILRKTL